MSDYSRHTAVKKIDINFHLHGAYIVDNKHACKKWKGGGGGMDPSFTF